MTEPPMRRLLSAVFSAASPVGQGGTSNDEQCGTRDRSGKSVEEEGAEECGLKSGGLRAACSCEGGRGCRCRGEVC